MKNIKNYNSIFIVLVFVLLFSQLSILNGQINIEKQRKGKIKKFFETSLGFSLSLFKGNTNLLRLNVDFRVDFRKRKNSGFIIGNLTYGEKSGLSYIDKGFTHLRYIRDIFSRFMIETFAQKEYNDFLRLKKRELAGAGIRIHILSSRGNWGNFNLYSGIGLMYEIEKYSISSNDIQKENTSLFKSTNYISVNFTSNKFSVNNVTYLQTNIGNDRSTRIYSDFQFAVKLSKILSYTAGMNYRYANDPAPTVKNYDLQIKNGLKIIF